MKSKLKEWCKAKLTYDEFCMVRDQIHIPLEIGVSMMQKYWHADRDWPEDKIEKCLDYLKKLRPEVTMEDLFYKEDKSVAA